MPVRYVAGDIFATPCQFKAFAHGCNCAGKMGAGIAVQFKERWLGNYGLYVQKCATQLFEPGDVLRYEDDEGNVIYNLGTQKHWRTDAKLSYIATSLSKMVDMAEENGDTPEIVMPRIGAGLGGLNWDDVKEVIEYIGGETDILLVVCDEYVRDMPL